MSTSKFDLHVHSEFSDDSSSPVKEIIKLAKIKGLRGLAFLDHNTLQGYYKAREYTTDLILVPALEVSTPYGHVGALGIQEEIGRFDTVLEAVESINEHGGIAIAVHPYRIWSGIGSKIVKETKGWTAIEGLNGRNRFGTNKKAQKLARHIDLPVTGGSDAHDLDEVGKAYTLIEDVSSWEDLISEIKNGNIGIDGQHQTIGENIKYALKSVSEWVTRGFKRM